MPLSKTISFVIDFLQNLPSIMSFLQLIFFILFALFLGRIAVSGYRSYTPKHVKLLLKLPLGTMALFSGFFLSSILPGTGLGKISEIFQIEIVLYSIISSLVLLLGLHLLSKNLPNPHGIKKLIEKLSKTRKTKVITPSFIAGACIIALLSFISLSIFPGFPNIQERFYNEIGMTPEEISSLLSIAESQPGNSQFRTLILAASFINNILPIVLPGVQAIIYISFILFFGWLSTLTLPEYYPRGIRLATRLATGFFSLICGIAISAYITLSDIEIVENILEIMQINVLIAGIIASSITAVAVFLITRNIVHRSGIKTFLKKMKKKLREAEDREAGIKRKPLLRRPSMLIGMMLVILIACFGVTGLSKIPSTGNKIDEMLASSGTSREELISQLELLEEHFALMEAMNETGKASECPPLLDVFLENSDTILSGKLERYEDSRIQNIISQATKSRVISMFKLTYKDKDVVLGVTENKDVCLVHKQALCECMKIPEV